MKKVRSHFSFNKQERSGIFFLLLVILLLQVVRYTLRHGKASDAATFLSDSVASQEWEALAHDEFKTDSVRVYSFNPNYLTDFKAYTLGMSPMEMDRLQAFRRDGKFVNSAMEFQQITQVSDSLLSAISPNFKFPAWRNKKREKTQFPAALNETAKGFTPAELNTATEAALRVVPGIGEKLASRIVRFRTAMGGFVEEDQLYDVYGLDSAVVRRTFRYFRILDPPKIQKLDINLATAEDLARITYLRYEVIRRIISYREEVGNIGSLDELKDIEGFPVNRIERIKLYLTL